MLDYSNLFDFAKDLYAIPSYFSKCGIAKMPLRYFFELTYRCNLNCPYCYVGSDRYKNELSTKEWFDLIEQVPFYSLITIVGGEPLLRKDFSEILFKACEKTLGKVNVVTNGVLMNEDILNVFVQSKMMLLSVSLDGFGKTHDINRNREGLFNKVISNIEKINEYNKRPMIDIKTIVLENNLDDLPKLYKLCDEMNFQFLSISFLRNNNLKQNSVLKEEFSQEFLKDYPIKPYFDMEHFKEVYRELESYSKNSKVKIRFSPKFEQSRNPLEKIEKFFSLDNTPVNKIYKPCLFPFSNMFINPQGDVYPCLSIKVGNIRGKKIKEVFNMPQNCFFRHKLKQNKLFPACQMCCELRLK